MKLALGRDPHAEPPGLLAGDLEAAMAMGEAWGRGCEGGSDGLGGGRVHVAASDALAGEFRWQRSQKA